RARDALPEASAVQRPAAVAPPRRERAPPLVKEPAIRHLMREGVLEGEFLIWEELGLVEELGRLQMLEPPPEILLRPLRDRRQERVGHVLADHRGRLQEVLVLRS